MTLLAIDPSSAATGRAVLELLRTREPREASKPALRKLFRTPDDRPFVIV